MPTEIIGNLESLLIEPYNTKGRLSIATKIPVKYSNGTEEVSHYVSVQFLTDNKDVINIIRKSDGKLKLIGRFDNDANNDLLFFVKEAQEIKND